jgi:hypothetical protein
VRSSSSRDVGIELMGYQRLKTIGERLKIRTNPGNGGIFRMELLQKAEHCRQLSQVILLHEATNNLSVGQLSSSKMYKQVKGYSHKATIRLAHLDSIFNCNRAVMTRRAMGMTLCHHFQPTICHKIPFTSPLPLSH